MTTQKQSVSDQIVLVDQIEDQHAKVVSAIGAVDYMLGNRSTWSEHLFEEGNCNYDGLCRLVGAIKVPLKIKVGSLEDMKSYLLNEELTLSGQLNMEKHKLLRLMQRERDHMIQHYRNQHEDAYNRFKEADPQSIAWHRLQAIMETYKHLLFVANRDPVD